MKLFRNLILLALFLCLVTSAAMAGPKARKLPVSAYIKSAKIEILSDDLDRYPYAMSMLDSLFIHYGHHAEGLHWMINIQVDYIDKTPDPINKAPYVDKLIAYTDTLHKCCDNKDIKKKYRKNCDKYTEKADSVSVKFFREFYSLGVEQLQNIEELANDLKEETDTASIEYIKNDIQVNIDSVMSNMVLAIAIDPDDYKPYVALGNAYEKALDYEKSTEWMAKGLERASEAEKSKVLLPMAYNYINLSDYCMAAEYFAQHTDANPNDTLNLVNLAICYVNCDKQEEALATYRKILVLNPNDGDVIVYVGSYFNQQAQEFSRKANDARANDDAEGAKKWDDARTEAFDSSSYYWKTAMTLRPDDVFVAEQCGMACALAGNTDDAIMAFVKLTEIAPDNAENFKVLGSLYEGQYKAKEAVQAYEGYVAIDDANVSIWEALRDLYKEVGNTEGRKKALAKVKALSKN